MKCIQFLIYYYDLVCHLVRCDFNQQYKGALLGVLWSFLLPLAQLVVLVFIFQKIVPLGIDAYPAFVFSALLPWTWLSNSLNSASNLFIRNRSLIWQPNFAPFTLILVNTLSNFLMFFVVLPILFGVLLFYGRSLSLSLLILPLLMVIQGFFIVGMSLIVATLNVFYRDVQHIVSVGIMLLFYLTPIFYWYPDINKHYRIVFILNPIAIMIKSYRAILYYGTLPEWYTLPLLSFASVLVCGLGYFIYKRQIHTVIDAI